ncbi:MAG: CapA family protein [Lachnospiraceae bacterium]|nr:CapA family protein [Lachnospiraceae bacterium]
MSHTEVKERVAYWDNLKGLLIFLVVFGHLMYDMQGAYPLISRTTKFIYVFHMPAFVFVSGFFGKSDNSRSFRSIIRLIFLYVIMNSTFMFLYHSENFLTPLYSMWYLIALVVWRITANRIAHIKSIMLILFSVALFAGFFSSIDNTFAIARIIGFYPYYMAGYMLSEEKSEAFLRRPVNHRLLCGGIGIVAFTAVVIFLMPRISFTDNDLQMFAYEHANGSFRRMVLWGIGFLVIFVLRCIMPKIKIPFLTMIGRNSLWIFLLHRPFVLLLDKWLSHKSLVVIFTVSFAATVLICLAFGNDLIAKPLKRFADSGADIFADSDKTKFDFAKFALCLVAVGFVTVVVRNAYKGVSLKDLINSIRGEPSVKWDNPEGTSDEPKFRVMTDAQRNSYDQAFRITFAGDLILLEDQVILAKTDSGYDFTDAFEYTKEYISSADLAIGVFEGPMAGEAAGYSTSNFDDGKELALSFPDEFAMAVKSAGFDLVTTANNHVLDKGLEGAMRTLDVLDRIGLEHTGSYRSTTDKEANRVKLIEKNGIRIAILTYTYGSNMYPGTMLMNGELSYVTSVAFGTEGELFEQCRSKVVADFDVAKSLKPDLIVVLPHLGTQFYNGIDKEQETWFGIFKELGADVILGDHPHVVEPVRIEETNGGRKVFCAYCPGNFANSYREKQGDTSMLIDVYIDRDTKEVIGGAVVPLYTQAPLDGNYRALPIYEIVNDSSLRRQLSTDDYKRAVEAHKRITSVVLGREMDIAGISERYYINQSGYIRTKTAGLVLTDTMRKGTLWKAMDNADSVCFLGDSVTDGTKNGGCPWYEPMEQFLSGKEVLQYSQGGATVNYFTERISEIPRADLYVIAVGTNDVRYREKAICAMTAEEYVERIKSLRDALLARSPNSDIVLIAPWTSTDGDTVSKLSYSGKTVMTRQYCDALQRYCRDNNVKYINANPYIEETFKAMPASRFLVDYIHPNAGEGVRLYSAAVLSSQ